MVGAVALADDPPDASPPCRKIEEHVVEDQAIAEGRLGASSRRVRESLEEHAQRRLVRAEHRVHVSADDAVAVGRQRVDEGLGLAAAGAIAERPAAQQVETILQVRRDDEQALAGDRDRGRRGDAMLPLDGKIDRARVLQRPRRQNGRTAGGFHAGEHRDVEHRQTPPARQVLHAFDGFLQEQNVVTRWRAGDAAGREVVDQSGQIAASVVSVPGDDGQEGLAARDDGRVTRGARRGQTGNQRERESAEERSSEMAV